MSIRTHRDLIVAALADVDDVTAHRRFVAVTTAGTTYPRIVRIDQQKFGAVVFWSVVTVLPQDPAAAEEWVEDHSAALRVALDQAGLRVTGVEPRVLRTAAGDLPALFTNAWRREDD